MISFLIIVTLHFLEHLIQIIQLYIFKWERSDCLGILGLWQPWLVRSELLHYGYALFMLIGLITLTKVIKNKWWTTARHLQQFHHFEHLLLIFQAYLHVPMINRISIGSLFFSRIELHFFYNLMVMMPIMIALISNNKKSHIKNGVSI